MENVKEKNKGCCETLQSLFRISCYCFGGEYRKMSSLWKKAVEQKSREIYGCENNKFQENRAKEEINK